MLKSDYTGGLVMFAIMFTISFFMLYIFKNVRAFRASSDNDDDYDEDEYKEACNREGGSWNNGGDCCQFADVGPRNFPPRMRCDYTSQAESIAKNCPEACEHSPHSSFCKNCALPA